MSALIAGLIVGAPVTNAIGGNLGTAFQGSAVVESGSVNIDRNSNYVDRVTVSSPQAVITWTPADTVSNAGVPIDFLPNTVNGNPTSVIYQSSGSDFTVLNRVVPADLSRPISLNGAISSYRDLAQTTVGGNVWFYSPGGILVGANAVINVGGLLLTTGDPARDGNGNFANPMLDGNGNAITGFAQFSIGQAANGSAISIAQGAQIKALAAGSYIAMIAPAITQNGTVTVNGSAAYVAARAADMTINQGLFDISVTMPTEEAGPQLIHNGTTGMTFADTSAAGATDTHRIYLVSVPKNDAITLLIQGGSKLGFDVASGATIDGSAIILSAGRNVNENTQQHSQQETPNTIFDFAATPTPARASIAINTGTFTSAVTGAATRNAIVSNGGNSVSINFVSDLTLIAPNLVSVGSATAGQSVSIGRNLLLDASVHATTDGDPITAGTAQLFATGGGGITVSGTADILAMATGNGSAVNAFHAVDANGGTAQITSFGGAIDISGATTLDAGAFAGTSGIPLTALTLKAGNVNVQASGAGASVHLHDTLDGFASDSEILNPLNDDLSGSIVAGASGQGGSVLLENSGGGTLTVDHLARLNADGYGQSVVYGTVGGSGTGGQIGVNASDGAMVLGDGLQASARGDGGSIHSTTSSITSAGSGTGGQITIGAANATGSLTIGQASSEFGLDADASGQGGSFGVTGGDGVGGQVHLVANGGATHAYFFTSLDARGAGGVGSMSGSGTGGLAEAASAGGSMTLEGQLNVLAGASSGSPRNDGEHSPRTGNAAGGTAQIIASGTGNITINDDVLADASASVPTRDVSYNAGGNGTGGTVNLTGAGTATIHVAGGFDADVSASGGNNQAPTGAPGTGMGGKMFVDAQNMSSITIDDLLSGDATGTGGGAIGTGTGGAGTGGMLSVGGGSGVLTLGSVYLKADGQGGNGVLAGGAGSGGNVAVHVFTAGGSINVASAVDLSADGVGGDGEIESPPMGVVTTGGTGIGGSASIDAENGLIAIGSANAATSHIVIDASGFGGAGVNGGAGMGGGITDPTAGATIYAKAGGVIFTPSPQTPAPVQISANGQGGDGGTAYDGSAGQGGAGTGGFAGIQANNSTLMSDQSKISLPVAVSLNAGGNGGLGGSGSGMGTGGAGGAGTGGNAFLFSQAGNGYISVSSLTTNAEGMGGTGGGGTIGGIGGVGTGGTSQAGISSGIATAYTQGVAQIGDLTSTATGTGGTGGSGANAGGAGGAGQGGMASLISRGGAVSATSAILGAFGQGGGGGSGQSAQGVGGNGTGGAVGFGSTYRNQTTVSGSLAVSGQVLGLADGLAGNGRQAGQTAVGNFQIQALGGTLSASNLIFSAAGATVPSNAVASEVSAVGTGRITIANTLSLNSGGDIGLYFDQGGGLDAVSASIGARSVTPFGGQDSAAPTGTGTFHADSLNFSILQDFRTTASFTTPGSFVLHNVPGIIQTGDISATNGISIDFGTQSPTHGISLTTGNLTSHGSVFAQSDGNDTIGSVTAGDSIIIASTGGAASIGNMSAGLVNPAAASGPGYVAQVFAAGGSTIGSIAAMGEVRLQTVNGSVSTGDIATAADLIVLAKQNVSLGAVTTSMVPVTVGSSGNQMIVPGGIYIGHSNGTAPPSAQLFSTIPTRVEGAISFDGAVNTGTFTAAAAGTFTAPSINSNDYLTIDAGGTTTVNALISRHDTEIRGDGAVTIGSMDTGGEGHIEVGGQITVASATAGRMAFSGTAPSNGSGSSPTSGGNTGNTASDSGPSVVLIGGAGVSLGTASASGDIGLVSSGNVMAGTLVSDASVGALVGGNITLGSVTTGGDGNGLYIGSNSLYPSVQNANGNAAQILFSQTPPPPIGGSILITGPVSAGRFEAAALGDLTVGTLNIVNDAEADIGGSITTGAITSQQRIKFTSGASATMGALVAGNDIQILAGGTATVASASAGRANPSTAGNADYGVGIRSGTGVSAGDITALGNVGLLADGGDVSTGNVTADQSLVVLSANNVVLGGVATGATGSGNGVYIANASMYPLVADNLVPSRLFASTPAAVGGAVQIKGPVSTAQFVAASNGAFTANAISAGSSLAISSGGLATFNGAVIAPAISIGSLDIAVGSMASIGDASTTGLTLTSGATATTIGGTTTGASGGQTSLATSYTLDGAEAGRLHAAQINLAASGDITIGSLSLAGSGGATANLLGSAALFQVQTPGSIRVTGSVNLAGAAATDTLSFLAGQRFEVVTDTGQVQLFGTNGQVGGILTVGATNAAVGTSSLLAQLQVDPKFAGRDAVLASAPLDGGKPAGYLQAGKMAFTIGNTLLIQNSGVGSTLAGFTVGTGGVKIASSATSPIDVVIYGQALDSAGTAIPTSSIGGVVTASRTTPTANVDGCVFATGVCSPVNSGTSVQGVARTQLAGISSSIQAAVTGNVGAPGGMTGTSNTAPRPSSSPPSSSTSASDDDDEGSGSKGNGGGGGAKAAAAKPNVLIDTNAIAQTVNAQIDTPVTSSGNTSLWTGEDGLAGVDAAATGNNP